MAELDDALAEARRIEAELVAAKAGVAARADSVTRLRAARGTVARTADPRDPEVAARLSALDDEIAAATKELTAQRVTAADLRGAHQRASDLFGRLADPTKEAARLVGDTPVLLLPVRMQTRFKGDELWVRVYPDDWAVDSFEDKLSDVEVDSARRFWAAWWRAGGEEGRRRGAWRGLVGSHGSGRGGWIVQNHRPLDPASEPVRTTEDEVILVIAGDDPLPAGERAATAAWWTAVWRAATDLAAVDAARVALVAAVGEQRATAIEVQPPTNLDETPLGGPDGDRATVEVTVAFCDLPAVAPGDTKITSWTEAARAKVLPDRFVLLGYQDGDQVVEAVGNPVAPELVVGPDPSAAAPDQLRIEDGKLIVPDELEWMIDFDKAVSAGMGFRVALDGRLRRGFDRLLVLGLRVGAKPEESASELETLLTHHHHSRAGLALLPQGAPTNNTEKAGAAFDRADDADATYHLWLGGGSGLQHRDDWNDKQDGQWLAECLGLDPGVLATVPGAEGSDQAEARAANVALWPATWGYFLETMMHPLLDGPTIDDARAFFTRYVSGRGLVPAVRIGRQPYGILPTTVLSRLRTSPPAAGRDRDGFDPKFLGQLHELVRRIADDWAPLAAAVPNAGAGAADPHQVLLEILGLHPTSVEFHQRYAESVEDLFNRFRFDGFGPDFVAIANTLISVAGARLLLQQHGWTGDEDPAILDKLFHGTQYLLQGPLIDDRPLSETDPVRPYTDDGRNYLGWLVDASRQSLDTLRRQTGFSGDRTPVALLYLLLRHSLLLSWWDAGLRFLETAGVLDADGLRQARAERPFVHVDPADREQAAVSESRYQPLYAADPRVTGDERTTIADFVLTQLHQPPARHLAEVIKAVDHLADVPTARLERVLAEHVDCATYRLDAWRLGLVHWRLLGMRLTPDRGDGGGEKAQRGVHLGAYGWLNDVRPENKPLEPVRVPEPLAATFQDPGDPPLMRDWTNGGFVHAPSLNHAATAAVLRSGYLANATPAQPDVMAVNLSSERMRLAQTVIQGIRHGQTLGALLGYRLERGLHDRHGLAEVDELIHPLRLAFPSPGDRDGRRVLDGLDLVTHVERTGQRHYPFGRADLPAASTAQATAIDLEVSGLLDVHDAVGDLALAEGVHQAVLGNMDRVAATLDAYGKGGFPPEPDVLKTPRSGITLTQRLGLHLRPGLDHTVSPVPGLEVTPRAMADPAVNDFLARQLPPPADVVALVAWTDRVGIDHDRVVTQAELGLQPVDLLHVLHLGGQALGELDERLVRFVEIAEALPPDAQPTIRYTERVAGRTTFFEVAPLVGHLRSLVTRSRPLRATDVVPANEARRDVDNRTVQADRNRPAAVLAALTAHRAAAAAVVVEVDALLDDPVANRHAMAAQVDSFVDACIASLRGAGTFALTGSGWGEVIERRRALLARLLDAVDATIERWNRKLAEADAELASDAALPSTATGEERIRLLLLAEGAVATSPTEPPPVSAGPYRAAVEAKRAAFAVRLAGLRAVRPGAATLPGALASVQALLPLDAFEAGVPDGGPLDVGPVVDGIIELYRYVRSRLASSVEEADDRIAAATQSLADHDAAVPGQPRVDAIVTATRHLLGQDTVVVPEIVLPRALADEWDAAMAWSRTGQLTDHLTTDPTHPRPLAVDDWVAGLARVREKVHAWEQMVLLTGALGRTEPDLRPIQLPHASEPWLALELPDGFSITGDRILYTAHYPVAFDKAAPQCGLLVDEWTETIPGTTETSGIAFHHDSPDCEAPQAMLLVVPPQPTAAWRWQDLVDTLHETLDLARHRAVEPTQVDATPYSTFLPATVMAASVQGINIAANLAVNNNLIQIMRGR